MIYIANVTKRYQTSPKSFLNTEQRLVAANFNVLRKFADPQISKKISTDKFQCLATQISAQERIPTNEQREKSIFCHKWTYAIANLVCRSSDTKNQRSARKFERRILTVNLGDGLIFLSIDE